MTVKIMEFENDFFELLEKVQAAMEEDCIPQSVDELDEYGLGKLGRQGVTAHAGNLRVGDNLLVLKAINR